MRRCYMCQHWQTTYAWKDNCRKHPRTRDRFNQDATTGDCPDYEDRIQQYAVAGRKGAK